jgi:hypothetical protein
LGGKDQEDLIFQDQVQDQPGQKARPYLKNTQHKKGLVEWLK